MWTSAYSLLLPYHLTGKNVVTWKKVMELMELINSSFQVPRNHVSLAKEANQTDVKSDNCGHMVGWICFCTSDGTDAFICVCSGHDRAIPSGMFDCSMLLIVFVGCFDDFLHWQIIDPQSGLVIEELPTEKPFCFINTSAASNSTLKAFNYYR